MASDLKKQVETKRKANASPESEKPQPRLRRRGSLPDLHELTECANPKLMFPDLLRKSFMDPEIMQEVSPCLVKQIQPIIEKNYSVSNWKIVVIVHYGRSWYGTSQVQIGGDGPNY